MGKLIVGQTFRSMGDITTLGAIGGPRPPAQIEASLGFRAGRLNGGYFILLLLQQNFQPADFIFGGTTMRSGGRLGLPLDDKDVDKTRTHVTRDMILNYGLDHYDKIQRQRLREVSYRGPNRLVKVLPDERIDYDDPTFSPKIQFPMGGGGLQWTLQDKKEFLIALHVDTGLMAETPEFAVSLDPGQPFQQLYDNRVRVRKYLERAPDAAP